jgi:uncharacterized protein
MKKIIGRKEEIETLKRLKNSDKSEFVAVYGRRRVGKTFLVKNVFEKPFHFQLTGTANVPLRIQLSNFHTALVKVDPKGTPANPPKNWFEAFNCLGNFLESLPENKKIIFLDELPWLDAPQSYFVSALEYFWNSWASNRNDVLLIVCGSAAAWMLNEVIHNHGGLHNRVTERIPIQPFTLAETEAFLQEKGGVYSRREIAELYMAVGGIPFYLENIQVQQSIAQNIDRLFFYPRGVLRTEYDDLFRSLFRKPDRHIAIVEALVQKAKGLTQKDILTATKLPMGGSFTKVLNELEQSGFIKRYLPFGKNKRDAIYQLIDPYTLFYLNFVRDSKAEGQGIWLAQSASPRWYAWSGYAFEYLCRYHIDQLKKALGIGGVYTEVSAWRSQKSKDGAQIDLIIDRNDRVINLCEIKFSIEPFVITKADADNLQNKLSVFRTETSTKKTLFLTLIAANGLQPNEYSRRLVTVSLDLDALF